MLFSFFFNRFYLYRRKLGVPVILLSSSSCDRADYSVGRNEYSEVSYIRRKIIRLEENVKVKLVERNQHAGLASRNFKFKVAESGDLKVINFKVAIQNIRTKACFCTSLIFHVDHMMSDSLHVECLGLISTPSGRQYFCFRMKYVDEDTGCVSRCLKYCLANDGSSGCDDMKKDEISLDELRQLTVSPATDRLRSECLIGNHGVEPICADSLIERKQRLEKVFCNDKSEGLLRSARYMLAKRSMDKHFLSPKVLDRYGSLLLLSDDDRRQYKLRSELLKCFQVMQSHLPDLVQVWEQGNYACSGGCLYLYPSYYPLMHKPAGFANSDAEFILQVRDVKALYDHIFYSKALCRRSINNILDKLKEIVVYWENYQYTTYNHLKGFDKDCWPIHIAYYFSVPIHWRNNLNKVSSSAYKILALMGKLFD